jgi:hypothetical protein
MARMPGTTAEGKPVRYDQATRLLFHHFRQDWPWIAGGILLAMGLWMLWYFKFSGEYVPPPKPPEDDA